MEFILNAIRNITENANLILNKNNYHGALWLGNARAIIDADFLQQNNITAIINCTPNAPFIYELNSVSDSGSIHCLETLRIPVYDSLKDRDIYLMEQMYPMCMDFIFKKLIKEKQNIIVNCTAGRQRSGSVVAIALYQLNLFPKKRTPSETMRDIIRYILKCRPQAFSWGMRINFKRSIENYLGITF
jgi:hypothetical protein